MWKKKALKYHIKGMLMWSQGNLTVVITIKHQKYLGVLAYPELVQIPTI